MSQFSNPFSTTIDNHPTQAFCLDAARDRDGSNSPAWWSELNSNFSPV